jgi:U3 small nucleolar RNA-associated protein 14
MIERRAELATMRSLMFYKEQKQKKVAKIKSKTYRKIAKKALEKGQVELTMEELERLDPLKAQEERDKLEFERAKERMTLKHNNTGKWAKKMLGRHDGAGAESQKALMDQLRKGDELRKRIDGFESGDSEFEDTPDQNEKEELLKLQRQVDEDKVPDKGIFSMKFMQRGLETQKREAKEAIANAYKEFDNVSDYEEEEEKVVVNARRVVEHNPVDHKRKKPVKQIQMKSDGFEIAASGPVNIKPLFKVETFDDLTTAKTNVFVGDANKSEKESSLKVEPVAKAVESKKVFVDLKKLKVLEPKSIKKIDDVNPWLTGDEDTMVKRSIQSVHKQFERSSKPEKAIQKLKTEKQKLLTTQTETDNSLHQAKKLVAAEDMEYDEEAVMIHSSHINKINNKDLMKMAFANDDITEVFKN